MRGRGPSSCSSGAIWPSSKSSMSWGFHEAVPREMAVRGQQVPCPGFQEGLLPCGAEARGGAPGYGRRGAEVRRRGSRGEVRGLGLQLDQDLHRRWRARADAEEEIGAGANAPPAARYPGRLRAAQTPLRGTGARGRRHEGDVGRPKSRPARKRG